MSTVLDPFFISLSAVFGLVIGSFFNVLIYRLPRHESIVLPGSRCPHCGRPVKTWENIPVISYLFLGGKCAGCGSRIPVFYPVVECVTGAAAIALYHFSITPALAAPHSPFMIISLALQLLILLIVIPITVIDLSHFIIPDVLTLPLLAVAAACAFLPGGITPLQCVFGILAGGGTLFIAGIIGEFAFKRGEAMGGGDVKLMAVIGAAFGWKTAILTIMFGAVTGSVGGIMLVAFKKFSRDHKIPFGPFLSLGLWVTVFFGGRLISLYQGFVDRLIGF
jgi:leader peptidase (prepilin peptidase) / N-methyltransferase